MGTHRFLLSDSLTIRRENLNIYRLEAGVLPIPYLGSQLDPAKSLEQYIGCQDFIWQLRDGFWRSIVISEGLADVAPLGQGKEGRGCQQAA